MTHLAENKYKFANYLIRENHNKSALKKKLKSKLKRNN